MTDPTPTRAEVVNRMARNMITSHTKKDLAEWGISLEAENQALRERAEAAERLLAESRQHVIFWEAREVAARSEAAAAWNDAIEAAALLVDGNMLCGYGDSNGDEVLLPRSNPGNKLGFGYSRAIRALRRAAPTEEI